MRARARTLVAVVVGASALALSACGEPGPNTAAVVNGTVITTSEAQQAATEINQAFAGRLQQPFTTRQAVAGLIGAPFFIQAAEQAGRPVSEAAAKAAMPSLADPSPATVELYRGLASLQGLSQAQQQAALDAAAKANPDVSPRFGAFDAQRGLVATTPDWIVPSSPSPSPSPSSQG